MGDPTQRDERLLQVRAGYSPNCSSYGSVVGIAAANVVVVIMGSPLIAGLCSWSSILAGATLVLSGAEVIVSGSVVTMLPYWIGHLAGAKVQLGM